MNRLNISLFGKLNVSYADRPLAGCEAQKVQELLSYLLLHRNQPQPREILASVLWGDNCTTAHSRKYLRNALWRLHSALGAMPETTRKEILLAESEWIEFRSNPALQLDVERLEDAYLEVRGVKSTEISAEQAARLTAAANLYTGYLLSGWGHDWSISERDRLHHIYLLMTEKLAGYHEGAGEYERALDRAGRILTYDRAHESTHRRMMRLYYAMGYRTDALRQYERCRRALRDELDVAPASKTVALYEALRQDKGVTSDFAQHSHAA